MKKTLLLLAFIPAMASAQRLFGDEFMSACIKGAMDAAFAQGGFVIASERAKIVKGCLCLQHEYNQTITNAEYSALLHSGKSSDALDQKEAVAQTRCAKAVYGN
jgi:hypothetical protein